MLDALRGAGVPRTTPEVALAAGCGKDKARRRLGGLLRDLLVVVTAVPRRFGRGNRDQPAWRVPPADPALASAERRRLQAGEAWEAVVTGPLLPADPGVAMPGEPAPAAGGAEPGGAVAVPGAADGPPS